VTLSGERWIRTFGFSLPLAGHHHIDGATPATGTDEPLTPIGNGNVGAVSFGHFGGIRFDLMSAFPGTRRSRVAPRRGGTIRSDEHGSRSVPQRHRRADFGYH
jgi:hypothetical protein